MAKETNWSSATVRKYILLLDLPEKLQARLDTAQGPAKVAALATLAQVFQGDVALEVWDKIGGFNQPIQTEIIKRSAGDAAKIDELVEQAQAGAFDATFCGGSAKCEVIRNIVEGNIRMNEFQQLVSDVASQLGIERTGHDMGEAARAFWKALAR